MMMIIIIMAVHLKTTEIRRKQCANVVLILVQVAHVPSSKSNESVERVLE